jgi:trehalose 6-phosphate synthase/phosphatase
VLVGKKNLEVRPIAINKASSLMCNWLIDNNRNQQGEIVKRILYNHPEAGFVFCAGDDKVGSNTRVNEANLVN